MQTRVEKGIKVFPGLPPLSPAPGRSGWGPGTVTHYQNDKEPLDKSSTLYYSLQRAGSHTPLGKQLPLQESP